MTPLDLIWINFKARFRAVNFACTSIINEATLWGYLRILEADSDTWHHSESTGAQSRAKFACCSNSLEVYTLHI